MPTELEAKFAVQAHKPVRERLEGLGARFLGRVLETNSIHDRPDDSLRKSGCGLRVRGIELLAGEPQPATLTFKGPIQAGPFKKREEIELPLADADAMRRLLEAVGFVEVFRFRKRRESWHLSNCRVELDELPRLGRFVEIEGPTPADIHAAQDALGLNSAQHITRGYVGLLKDLPKSDGNGKWET
ncbi:MAG: class IV adenylate cyclase [Phycisphaerae bacterium]|nr:class IV adenylate cyclase [Phycisphaerae bacterium]